MSPSEPWAGSTAARSTAARHGRRVPRRPSVVTVCCPRSPAARRRRPSTNPAAAQAASTTTAVPAPAPAKYALDRSSVPLAPCGNYWPNVPQPLGSISGAPANPDRDCRGASRGQPRPSPAAEQRAEPDIQPGGEGAQRQPRGDSPEVLLDRAEHVPQHRRDGQAAAPANRMAPRSAARPVAATAARTRWRAAVRPGSWVAPMPPVRRRGDRRGGAEPGPRCAAAARSAGRGRCPPGRAFVRPSGCRPSRSAGSWPPGATRCRRRPRVPDRGAQRVFIGIPPDREAARCLLLNVDCRHRRGPVAPMGTSWGAERAAGRPNAMKSTASPSVSWRR